MGGEEGEEDGGGGGNLDRWQLGGSNVRSNRQLDLFLFSFSIVPAMVRSRDAQERGGDRERGRC